MKWEIVLRETPSEVLFLIPDMGRSAPYVMDEVSENGSEGVKGNASDGRMGEEHRVRYGRGRGVVATGGWLWFAAALFINHV